MNKMMSMILMVAGIVCMAVISIMYSFSTVEIPTGVYMALWCICIGIVRVSMGMDCGLEG